MPVIQAKSIDITNLGCVRVDVCACAQGFDAAHTLKHTYIARMYVHRHGRTLSPAAIAHLQDWFEC